jgi:thiol-disulfide isomerase/thioredoxin
MDGILCTLLLLLSLVAVPASAGDVAGCTPEASVKEVLDADEALSEECGQTPECWDRRRVTLKAALVAHPADVHLHRAYQDLHKSSAPAGKEIDLAAIGARYRGLAEEHGGDPAYLYLLGRWVADQEVVRDSFERAVAAGPDFPWAHLGLARLHSYDAERKDLVKAREHLGRFMDLCPSQPAAALPYHRLVDGEDFWRERLPRLRAAVEEGSPAEVSRAFMPLWSLEFKLRPAAEHELLRREVEADLERLEGLDSWDDPRWVGTLMTGYQLIGDDENLARVEDEALKLRPCDSVHTALERWQKEYPRPAEEKNEELDAWRRLYFGEVRAWSDRCPDDFNAAQLYYRAVPDSQVPALQEELVRAGERFAAAWDKFSGGTGGIFPSPYHQLAEVYLQNGLAERCPLLIDKALAEMEAKVFLLRCQGLSEDEVAERGRWAVASLWDSRRLLAEVRAELGELEAARELLAALEDELERMRPADGAPAEDSGQYDYRAGSFWRASARLADRQGRKLDAVAFYLKSNRFGRPRGAEDPVERARELWRELGGTDAGWRSFSFGDLEIETPSPWKERGEALAAFELTDLAGRTWSLAELRGKKVFANLWATWCGPCRQELPFVEDLHKRTKDQGDVVVVTLNLDDNPGLVAPYVEKSGFSFPVLFASDWTRDHDIPVAIPRNWLIDGEGNLVKEQVGFSTEVTADQWIGDVLDQLADLTEGGGP